MSGGELHGRLDALTAKIGTPEAVRNSARRTVLRNARDAADAALLLGALGLDDPDEEPRCRVRKRKA